MNRITASFSIQHTDILKQQMLHWVNRQNICSFLDNHQYSSDHQSVECLAAAGAANLFRVENNHLQLLDIFMRQHANDWLFGHISYELKNEIHNLQSVHPDTIGFPTVCFFQPEVVLHLNENTLTISTLNGDPARILTEIQNCTTLIQPKSPAINVQARFERDEYIGAVEGLKGHISRGDCYEINLCQEFFAENAVPDPVAVYMQLTHLSPNPFSCFYKLDDRYLMCASPERYLQKKNNTLVSQPIKGTAKRDMLDPEADRSLSRQLQNSAKDRSENVMVVDLVRNDLSQVCKEGTVKVNELFGIYSFPQVHQMISTITGVLKDGMTFTDILKATFPMGSMTGAPKRNVMQLIERYEKTKRGLYSGAVGYISPCGDFDFNVVIRSILYNAASRNLSYLVGGGITFYSDPELEYDECLLKGAAIKKVLAGI